jgi:hypothetical protein
MNPVNRKLTFTPTANAQLTALETNPANAGTLTQVKKTLKYLEADPRHPSLHTHEYDSMQGANGERVWEAYAQNKTPGAYRVFFHYGPDEVVGAIRLPVLTIIAITPHP